MTEDEYEEACNSVEKMESFKQLYENLSEDLFEVQEAMDWPSDGPEIVNEDALGYFMCGLDDRIDELKDQIHDYEEENNE